MQLIRNFGHDYLKMRFKINSKISLKSYETFLDYSLHPQIFLHDNEYRYFLRGREEFRDAKGASDAE